MGCVRQITAPVAQMARAPRYAHQTYASGRIIFDGTRQFELDGHLVHFANGVTLTHSSSANCVVVEGRIVAGHDTVEEGVLLTVNFNLFNWAIEPGFKCPSTGELVTGFRGMEAQTQQDLLYLSEPEVRATAMENGWVVASTNKLMTIRPHGGMGQTAFAAADIPEGVTLFQHSCPRKTLNAHERCTMYTICVGHDSHLLFGQGSECISHSCDPNVKVQLVDGGFDFVTVRPIKAGETVTFNYLSSEWTMEGTFNCLCGAATCFLHPPNFFQCDSLVNSTGPRLFREDDE